MPSKTFSVSFKESGFRRVSRRMAKMSDRAEEAGDSIDHVGDEADDAADSIEDAGDESQRTGKKMASSFGIGRKAITAMTAAVSAGIAGMGVLTKHTADYARQVDNAAEQSGMAAEDIQEIAFAARAVSGTRFDAVRDGLKELAIRSQEAANGTGEAKEAFDELGISQQFLKQSTPTEVFRRVRQELSKASRQTRIFASEMIFGGEAGEKLVETLGLSAKEMERLRQKAHETGAVMSTEQVESVEEARQSWDELTASLSGLGKEIATDLLPLTKDLLGLLKELTSWMNDLDETTRKTILFGGAGALALGPAAAGVQRLTSAIKTLYGVISGASLFGAGGLGALITGGLAGGAGLAAIMNTTSAAGKLSDRTQELTSDFTALRQELQNVEGSQVPEMLNKIRSQHEQISGVVGGVTAQIQKRESRLEQLKQQREELSGAAQRGIQQTIERKQTELDQLKQEQVVLKGLMNALSRLRSEWKDVGSEVDTTGDKAQDAAEKMRQAVSQMPEAPPVPQVSPDAAPIEGGVSFEGSLSGIFEGEGVAQIRAALNQGVVQSVNSANAALSQLRSRFQSATSQKQRARIQALINRVQRLKQQFRGTTQQTVQWQQIGRQALGVLQHSVSRVASGVGNIVGSLAVGQSAFHSFAEVGKQAISQLISRITSLITKMLVLKPLLSFLGGGLFGGLGSLFGGGGGSFSGAISRGGMAFADSGGRVLSDGLAKIHEGETILTEGITSKLSQLMSWMQSMQAPSFSMPDVTVPSLTAPAMPASVATAVPGGRRAAEVHVTGEFRQRGTEMRATLDETSTLQRRSGRA